MNGGFDELVSLVSDSDKESLSSFSDGEYLEDATFTQKYDTFTEQEESCIQTMEEYITMKKKYHEKLNKMRQARELKKTEPPGRQFVKESTEAAKEAAMKLIRTGAIHFEDKEKNIFKRRKGECDVFSPERKKGFEMDLYESSSSPPKRSRSENKVTWKSNSFERETFTGPFRASSAVENEEGKEEPVFVNRSISTGGSTPAGRGDGGGVSGLKSPEHALSRQNTTIMVKFAGGKKEVYEKIVKELLSSTDVPINHMLEDDRDRVFVTYKTKTQAMEVISKYNNKVQDNVSLAVSLSPTTTRINVKEEKAASNWSNRVKKSFTKATVPSHGSAAEEEKAVGADVSRNLVTYEEFD